MSDLSIRETIEVGDGTPRLTEPADEHADNAIDSDTRSDDESDQFVQPHRSGGDDDDSLDKEFDNHDLSSLSVSPNEADVESSRTVAHDPPSLKTARLSRLFANFTEEFLDIVEEGAQEAFIAAARTQNTELGQQVKEHDRDMANLTDELNDHVSDHSRRGQAELEKVWGEMRSLKRSIDKRDLSNSAFQNDISDRFASLEQSVTDRLLMLKIISSRMARVDKSINGRFACLEQRMNDRLAELERID